ncbi:MAG: alkaline phosphatase D family protein [Pirellulaceae bacterium]
MARFQSFGKKTGATMKLFDSAVTTFLCTLSLLTLAAHVDASEFESRWDQTSDRVWIGPDFWANRLHDWRIADGRLECVERRPRYPMRTVHLLTHQLTKQPGHLAISVRTGLVDLEEKIPPSAATGLLLGAGSGEMDYRAAAIVHHSAGPGGGIFVGVDGHGRAFIVDNEKPVARSLRQVGSVEFEGNPLAVLQDCVLRVLAAPSPVDPDLYVIRASVHEPESNRRLSVTDLEVPATRVAGNVALVSHPGRGEGTARFWFRDWELEGAKLVHDEDHVAGPILCTQYTLSRNVLKMTAQLMPVGPEDEPTVTLQIRKGDAYETVAKTHLVVPGWAATFRIGSWDSTKDTPYRVVYGDAHWTGTVRRDPVEKETIVVAGFTGNHNNRHGLERGNFDWNMGMWFPHRDLTEKVAKHKPDVLFFSGDQVYEGASPTHPDLANIKLDYLYKWYLWCWAYRHLTRDIPTITIPDDHDVYQGNLWGESGRKTDKDDKGGYVHPADFVKMVERTQTSHLPDPYDPTPVEQGIGVYYTDLVYGRIGIAILEDRKFKTGCNGRVPASVSSRADHIIDPSFDVTKADVPGAKLLGDRQLAFLDEWARDWRGTDMKMAVSQTVFANVATHHGGGLQYLRTDLDSNGWPQSGRARALRALRRAFAFHLAGDQHLATIVHHGIDDFMDAGWTFAVPSIANFYPRAWSPGNTGKYVRPEVEDYTGNFRDGLGNPVTVYAATNPGRPMGHEPAALHDNMPGYGIVKLNKRERTITMECWPRFADPDNPQHPQYTGWPKTIKQVDNYARPATAFLPELHIHGVDNSVVQVVDDNRGETVYTLRINGSRFRPKVFRAGKYSVKISDPDGGVEKTLRSVQSVGADSDATLDVTF